MTPDPIYNTVPTPGIRFETRPPAPVAVLPRMDIAAFVGFAASGPLHLPVPVEDLPRFRDIFGDDPVLAWDAERLHWQRALLGPSVDAFFRNGGRRCWVVRVAGDGVERASFQLPGLVSAAARRPAALVARSPGTWADVLRVAASLVREPLQAAPGLISFGGALLGSGTGEPPLWLYPAEQARVRNGDLLEVRWPDQGLALWGFAEVPEEGAAGPRVALRGQVWLGQTAAFGSPSASEPGEALEIPQQDALARLALAGEMPKLSLSRLTLDLRVRHQPVSEDLSPLNLDPISSPISARSAWRLSGLAFDARHQRFFGSLPDDSALFRLSQGRADSPILPERVQLLGEVANPSRFPLAGAHTDNDMRWLPLGLPSSDRVPGLDGWIRAEPPTSAGRAQRDGLDHQDPGLFTDPALEGLGVGQLMAAAEHRYYLEGRSLRGLHALLPVDEVTLVAVPDLIQRPWERSLPPTPEGLMAPILRGAADEVGEARLHWTRVIDRTRYQLQRADALFRGGWLTIWQGTEEETLVVLSTGCADRTRFRVRAFAGGAPSPWSNTLVVPHEPSRFRDCGEPVLMPLVLRREPPTSHESETTLIWGHLDGESLPGDLSAQIQRSSSPSFRSVTRVSRGIASPPAQWIGVTAPSDLPAYYRVRAGNGQPWSNTVVVHPNARSDYALVPAEDVDWAEVIAVQQSLLRFSAARGDLLALLSLPRGFRQADTGRHLAALTRLRAAASDERRRTLSFGAVYHPWVLSPGSQDDAELSALPPDGLVLGMMASQSTAEGAWIPPANVPLRGPLALEPALDAAAERRLAALGVNPLAQRPRGFLTQGVTTLSAAGEVTDIQVRRLLILLRRLALREGNLLVFEPGDGALRGRIRLIFERLLEQLYQAGAFAGATPAEAYRVVVDRSVNPPRSLELGRLIVELRVLPALAVERIRVRLIQDGPEGIRVEGS